MKTSLTLAAALIITATLDGCISRQEIQAELWLQSGVPPEVCAKLPEVAKYGLYRKLNDGKYEFISYCKTQSANYIAIQNKRFNEILDALLPKGKVQESEIMVMPPDSR